MYLIVIHYLVLLELAQITLSSNSLPSFSLGDNDVLLKCTVVVSTYIVQILVEFQHESITYLLRYFMSRQSRSEPENNP